MMWSLTVQAGKAEQSQTVFPNMLENHPLQDVKCQKGDLEFYKAIIPTYFITSLGNFFLHNGLDSVSLRVKAVKT